MRYAYLLFLLCCYMLLFAGGEKEQPGTLNRHRWEELSKDLNYEEQPKKSGDKKKFSLPEFDVNPQLIKYTFFTLVLGVLIYFLVRYIISLQSFANTESELPVEVHTLLDAEENLLKANLAGLIAKLAAAGNYREATRAHYLLLLQSLHKAGLIEWQKPKTNFDYVREVQHKPYYRPFSQLTVQFELVWYGKMPLSMQHFNTLQQQFTQFQNSLRNEE